jgi:protein ImuB
LNVVSALRRCRQPVPARAVVEDGRPVRLVTDRRGFPGGRVLIAAGPWRTSGEWWAGGARRGAPAPVEESRTERRGGAGTAGTVRAWNRDEWDVALADGAVYRIFRDRETEGWFIDAIVD